MRGQVQRRWGPLAIISLILSVTAFVVASPASGGASGDAGSLTGGDNFTCAVTSADTLKCWGSNARGQFGDGTTTSQVTPKQVAGISGVAEVSAGWNHTCVLTSAGGVKCTGLNANGQVGNGTTTTPQLAFVDVTGLTSGVAAISAGTFHTCALTDVGGVSCWGANSSGAIGDGTTTDRPTPVDVTGLATGVDAIAAGGGVTCAVLDTGALKCWGDNQTGGVGDGTTTNRLTPTDVIGLGSGVASASAESTHPFGSRVCAVTTGGAAKCWGTNNQGQLGDGTTTHRSSPVDVVGLGSGVAHLTTGSSQTCALTTGGAAKCWGQFAVGAGDAEIHLTPTDVVGLGSGVVELQAGGFHTCAQLSSGAVKCWGGNSAGQLGLGFVDGQSGRIPRDVSGSFHRPECPTVVPNQFTQFTSTDGYAAGSVLTFSGEPGFAVDGAATLTCQGDLTFDGPPPPASSTSMISLEPPSGIHGGGEIAVELSGFAPDTDIGWCQAIDAAPAGAGNCSEVFLGTTDSSGTVHTSLRMDRFIYAPGPSRWADCAVETCLLGAAAVADLANTAVTTELDIVIDPPPATRGTITLDPARQTGGQSEVGVVGQGFRPNTPIEIFQCTNGPASPANCDDSILRVTSDSAGDFTLTPDLTVSASIEPVGGGITLCFSPSGACVIAAAEAADFPGTVATAPLVDVGPVPTVLPGSGLVVEGDSGVTMLEVEVTLSNDSHETIEVPWSTIFNDTWNPALRADPGIDYTAHSGTVVFAPTETSKTVSIPIITDNVAEPTELVVVSFRRPTNARLGGFYGLGFGGIIDDDSP